MENNVEGFTKRFDKKEYTILMYTLKWILYSGH